MQEKIPDLKQFRKESNRHVLVLEAQVSEQDKYKLIHLSNNVLRTAGNDLTGVMKKNYDQLVRTKRYRHLQSLYGKAKKAGRDKEMKAVGAEMKQMQEEYHVTWEFCRQSMIRINKQYHLNSIFALTQAEDVWKGVEACLYREGKTLHFRKYGDHPEIRAKQAVRGIIVRLDGGSLSFRIGDITLFPIINKPRHTKTRCGHDTGVKEAHDLFAEEEIAAVCHYLEDPETADRAALELFRKKGELMDTYRPCYASLCFKEIRGRVRVFIHLTIEGLPKPKRRKDGSRRHQLGRGVVGCDIGPQTIACTSKKEVILKNLAERGMSIKKREQKEAAIQRKMARSRRAMNPENYREDGTIRKGKKTWKKSRRYRKLQKQYRNLSRIAAENRHFAINEDVNHIRELGNVFVTEPGNAKKLQKRAKKTERQEELSEVKQKDGTVKMIHKYKRKKRHGRSIQNRCPGYFQAQVKAKFERSGGVYIEVPFDYRASQYDHTCGSYIKKLLSQRMYCLSDGTRVQRDWYSSFLLFCIGHSLDKISRYKCKTYFEAMYRMYLALEQYIIENHIRVMNSGIKAA